MRLFTPVLILTCAGCAQTRIPDVMLVPQIDGEWWTVAGNPDLGELTTDRQQPVDFGIWQADDGTRQLWSYIRRTKAGYAAPGLRSARPTRRSVTDSHNGWYIKPGQVTAT